MQTVAVVIVFVALVGAAGSCQICYGGPSFQGIGFLPGYTQSRAEAVSSDGSVIVGSVALFSWVPQPVRWSRTDGMASLGLLPGMTAGWSAAVSSDGSVIVGGCGNDSQSIQYSGAFRWTAGGGMTGLGNLPDGGFSSFAAAVSADGTVVVGVGHRSLSFDHQVFRWTSDSGMTVLGNTPTGATPIGVAGISADGAVVTGLAMNDSTGNFPCFRWTATQGMQELVFLSGATSVSSKAISGDGRVIVGGASDGFDSWAFRWTQEEGMQSLGDLPSNLRDGHAVEATAVSADGSIILGSIFEAVYLAGEVAPDSQAPTLLNEAQTTPELSDGAFIWTAATGMRNLKDVLNNDYGLDLMGWTLDEVTGISADGRVIVGNGYDPQGQLEGWVATVPEPGVAVLLVMGGLLAFRGSRASRCNLHLRRDSDA